jgi:hypothetical protein
MKINKTENMKENLGAVNEKSAEMIKSFIESSAKQFDITMNASKAIFEAITKQYSFKGAVGEKTDEAKNGIQETIATANKWFSESSKIMMDLYEKQSKHLLDSYNSYMNLAYEGLNKINENEHGGAFRPQVEMFIKNLEDSAMISKKMFSTVISSLNNEDDKVYVTEVLDMMLNTYNKQTEELVKFSKNLFDTAQIEKSISLNKEISEKLQKDMERNFEASKKLISAIADTYKETDLSAKAGSKMLDEIFAEIDVVTKNNIKFWNNWFEQVRNSKASEKSEKTVSSSVNGHKS